MTDVVFLWIFAAVLSRRQRGFSRKTCFTAIVAAASDSTHCSEARATVDGDREIWKARVSDSDCKEACATPVIYIISWRYRIWRINRVVAETIQSAGGPIYSRPYCEINSFLWNQIAGSERQVTGALARPVLPFSRNHVEKLASVYRGPNKVPWFS